MAVQNNCTPANIFGPLQQTLFLGLSVRDFSAQAGWNDQASTLTVTLVQDNCVGNREYFDSNFTWTSAEFNGDPGFNYAPLGSPAIFKIGEVRNGSNIIYDGFEFAGIIQSYNIQDGADGLDIVTVNLVSPNLLLAGSNLILDSYTQPINVLGNPNYPQNVLNLINIYGYLESELGYECPSIPNNSIYPSGDDPFGPGFGTPGNGYGGAEKTSAGVPWILVKQAIQILCGGQYNGDVIAGSNLNFSSSPGSLKYIAGIGTYGSIPSDQYILDISELPGELAQVSDGGPAPNAGGGGDGTQSSLNQSNQQYRINASIMTIMDLISQVSEEAGIDYIIHLMPTKANGYATSKNTKTGQDGPVTNVIKLRAVPRIDVPDSTTLGSINNFIALAEANGILIDSSVGQELVQENNAAYIIGGARQDLFQVYDVDNAHQGNSGLIYPFLGYQPDVKNSVLTGVGVSETKYLEPIPVWWGTDPFGKIIDVDPFGFSDPDAPYPCISEPDYFLNQWFFDIDYNQLPLNIYVDLKATINNIQGDPESLLSAALGDFESFLEWFFVYLFTPSIPVTPSSGPYKGQIENQDKIRSTKLVNFIGTTYNELFPPDEDRPFSVLDRLLARKSGPIQGAPGFEDSRLTYEAMGTNASFAQRNFDLFFQDLKTIYEYLNKIASEYYGKAFTVEIPGLCFYIDKETKEVVFSDEPATDGAWVDTFWSYGCGDGDNANFGDPALYPNCISGGTTGIMGLRHPEQTDFFADDQGKLPAIMKYDPYLSYGKVQENYNTVVDKVTAGAGFLNEDDYKAVGPPNFFQPGNLGDSAFRNSPFGFSTLGFEKFTPLYVRGNVEEAWTVFKKPEIVYKEILADIPACSGGLNIKDISPSVCAIVRLDDGVFLAPSLGYRFVVKDGFADGFKETFVPDFPFFGMPDEIVNQLGNNFRLGTWYNDWTFSVEGSKHLQPTEKDVEHFKNISQSYVDSILRSTSVSVGRFPFALPCNAVIPIKSNTRTYGPWYNQGYTDENNPILSNLIQGKIHTEQDESAVPWEFGGTLYLYQGMQAKINNLIMKMQNAERGSVTVAGYPQKQLGTSLWERPSYINNGNDPESERGVPRELIDTYYTTNNGDIKHFYVLPTYPSGQPLSQITDMSISVGSNGIQTSYTLSAYTPFKNRFTKNNYQRIKDQGLNKFKQRRVALAESKKTPKGKFKLTGGSSTKAADLIFHPGTSFAERSAPALFIGQYLSDNGPAGPPSDPSVDPKNWFAGNASRKEVASQTLSHIKQLANYNETALMSMDGLIRPIRKRANIDGSNVHPTFNDGSGLGYNLPVQNDTGNFYANLDPNSISGFNSELPPLSPLRITPNPYYRIPPVNSGILKPPSYARVVDQQNSIEPMGPLNGGVSSDFFPRPTINAEFLNFLANPGSDLVNRGRGNEPLSGTFGHDIEVVARSSGAGIIAKNAGYISLLATGNSIGYSDDYRFMAMRGPIMVHGWGYDLQGKPIPNSNETGVFSGQWDMEINQAGFPSTTGWLDQSYWTSGSPFSGQHRKDYNLLTDEFYSGWLNQPETWPAGPIDLRWDRQRSVWTVPNSYEFVFVDLESGIGKFSSGDGFVRNYTDMYDAAGTPIYTDITVVNPFNTVIEAQTILAFYSKRFGTWFPMTYCCQETGTIPPVSPPPPQPTGCYQCNGQGACYWECVNGQWVQQGECPQSAGCDCLPPGNCNNCPNGFEGKIAAGICIRPWCNDVAGGDCNGGGQAGGNDSFPPGGSGPDTPIINFRVGNDPSFSGIGLQPGTEFNTYSTQPLRGRLQSDITSYGVQSTGWGYVELYDGYETVFSGPYAAVSGSGFIEATICTPPYSDDINCPPSGDRDNFKYAIVMNDGISSHLPSGTDVIVQLDKQYGLFKIIDYTLQLSQTVTTDTGILFYKYINADASSNNIVLSLPDATGSNIPGNKYAVKKSDSTTNTVIVSGYGSQLIDGQSTYVINNQYEAAEFVAIGTGWMVF